VIEGMALGDACHRAQGRFRLLHPNGLPLVLRKDSRSLSGTRRGGKLWSTFGT